MAESGNSRKWFALVVLSLALAIIVIDTTLLNVALSTIIREFQTTIQNIQWVITAYALTLAALTITGGRLGDLFGRKRMFMLGAVIFAIGSFVASDSHAVSTMIWGESIIEGVGAALMMPATSSLLVSMFKGRERGIAFGVWGAIAAAASVIGPILGGWLTTNYSWRWGFRINVVVAALLLLGSFVIAESRDTEEKASLDFIGVILSALGLLAVVFGVIEASTYGWWKAKDTFMLGSYAVPNWLGLSITPYAIFVGIIFLVIFFWWQMRVEAKGNTPLVSMKLFQNRQFTTGSITTAVMSLSLTGLIFSLPIFLQAVKDLDAYHTGLTLLPMSLIILVAAPLSGFLSGKIRPKYIIITGLLLNAIGGWVLRNSLSVDATTATLAPGLMIFGAGVGLVMAQISNLTLSAVSIQQAGEASGVNNTLRQVGSTLGSAIIGAILLSSLSSHLVSGIQSSSVIPETVKPVISQAVASQTSNVEFGGGAMVNSQIPPTISTEIKRISLQATVDANKESMAYGIGFSILGLLTAFFLPSVKSGERHDTPTAGH